MGSRVRRQCGRSVGIKSTSASVFSFSVLGLVVVVVVVEVEVVVVVFFMGTVMLTWKVTLMDL